MRVALCPNSRGSNFFLRGADLFWRACSTNKIWCTWLLSRIEIEGCGLAEQQLVIFGYYFLSIRKHSVRGCSSAADALLVLKTRNSFQKGTGRWKTLFFSMYKRITLPHDRRYNDWIIARRRLKSWLPHMYRRSVHFACVNTSLNLKVDTYFQCFSAQLESSYVKWRKQNSTQIIERTIVLRRKKFTGRRILPAICAFHTIFKQSTDSQKIRYENHAT